MGSEAIDARAEKLIAVAKNMGFEGVVAKRKDSCYEFGKRSGAWVKLKINKSQPFVIGGYTPGNPFDSIIVGNIKTAISCLPARCETGSCRASGPK